MGKENWREAQGGHHNWNMVGTTVRGDPYGQTVVVLLSCVVVFSVRLFISPAIVMPAAFISVHKGWVFAAPLTIPSTIHHPPSSSRLVFLMLD